MLGRIIIIVYANLHGRRDGSRLKQGVDEACDHVHLFRVARMSHTLVMVMVMVVIVMGVMMLVIVEGRSTKEKIEQ